MRCRVSRLISVLVAQFPISLDISANLQGIRTILSQAQPHDLVVLPEGALSGYSEDHAFLQGIDLAVLEASLRVLRDEVCDWYLDQARDDVVGFVGSEPRLIVPEPQAGITPERE